MKPASSIQPGVLTTFRLFIAMQLVISLLSAIVHWPAVFRPKSEAATLSLFSLLEAGLLFLYLSLPGLPRLLKQLYLPIAIVAAAAGPILDPYLGIHPFNTESRELFAQLILWRQIILLLIPLVVVGWQYSLREVIVFCGVTTLLNMVLLLSTWAIQDMLSNSLVGIIAIEAIIFVLVGHMIANLMQVQREQQRRLTDANAQLAQYAVTLEQLTVSRERNRMAQELHDLLAHTLSGVSVELEGLRTMLRVDPEQAQVLLSHSQQAIREGLTETRRALQQLRAKPLEELGLALAVRTLAESYASRFAVKLTVTIDEELGDTPSDVQQCIYRIAQEALTNVATHAQAQSVEVGLKRVGTQLRLLIRDDGCGFDPSAVGEAAHYGLFGMRERAALIGGTLAIESQAGKGTLVSFASGGNP